MALGTLFLIPSPLAPVEPGVVIPASVASIVRRLDTFVVENEKTARSILRWFAHPAPLQSLKLSVLNEHTPERELAALLAPLLDGIDIGLLSEAGCPAVADPGAALVRMAHQHDVRIMPLVGPSSLLLALMASGLNGQHFAFHGYLPIDRAQRGARIRELERRSARAQETQLFIETPYRNDALLQALLETCQPRTWLCVASDLTGANERVITRKVDEWRANSVTLSRVPSVFLLLSAAPEKTAKV